MNNKSNYGVNIPLKFNRALKITLLSSFLLVGLAFFTNMFAQNSKVNIPSSSLSIHQILEQIETQTDYLFVYNKEELNLNKKVKLANISNTEVYKVLDQLFKNTEISYVVEGNNIVLKTGNQPIQGKPHKKVTGKVLDQNGEPVIGASIMVKGEKANGTISDLDGAFTLSAPLGAVLTISYVGFVTQNVEVGNKALDIVLYEDSKVLNEIIVTGYGAVAKKNLTTAIVKVKTDEVSTSAVSNMSQMLMGRAAGLQATMQNAQPGGNVSISVRGGGTPIYVIDGIVMPSSSLENSTSIVPANVNRGGLDGLNPEDIESIEVLKDASASIYGIGAANGVVLVTTKKGAEGKMKVFYSGSMALVKNYKQLPMLTGAEYMQYVDVFGKETYLLNHKMGVYGDTEYDNGYSRIFSDNEIAQSLNTNWYDEVLRTGSISNHNISLQGGTKTLNYYLSGQYYKQEGTVKNSDMERFVLRSNVSAQLVDFFKLTTAININSNKYNNGLVGQTNGGGNHSNGSLAAAMTYPAYLPVYDENGSYTQYSYLPNPAAMNNISDVSTGTGFNVNFTGDIDIVKNMLTAKLVYGYNKENSDRDTFIPSTVYFSQLYQSRGNLGKSDRTYKTLEATLSFNKQFSDNFRMDAVVGVGKYVNTAKGQSIRYTDIHDTIGNDNVSAASGEKTLGSWRTKDEKRSQFVRASFDLFDRYVISGVLRRDGTDKFFSGKKYAYFPSVSAAWKIFNEKFMEKVDWVDMLKLRASYGVTGRDNLGTTLYGSFSASPSYIVFNEGADQKITYYLSGLDYPSVTWEKTIMKNIGLDFSILNDRINGSFDYFWNDVTNMLGTATSPGLSLLATYPINGGHIRRYGWDFTLNTTNVITHGFKWSTTLTLSHYNSVWKERMPNYTWKEYERRKDEPVNALYFYRTNGIVNADKSNMPDYQPEGYQNPGCPIIEDLNGDSKITVDDVDMVNVIPSIYGGLSNSFSLKNWDLDIFLYTQLGLKKYNYIYTWANGSWLASQNMNQSALVKEVWTSENPKGTIPGLAATTSSFTLPGGAGTDIGYENASFVRVRNITLGYNFTNKQLGVLGKFINTIRVYADLQNPFTFTSFRYFDPEVQTGNASNKGSNAEYPVARAYTLGLKVSF